MTQKECIVALMSDMKWHTNVELNGICFRYGARLWELKHEEGYLVEKRNVPKKPGLVEYRFAGRKDVR